jgi:hypothetical protein
MTIASRIKAVGIRLLSATKHPLNATGPAATVGTRKADKGIPDLDL